VEEVQSIEFKDADSKNLNKDIKETGKRYRYHKN
jgi:hypothetical protein